MAERKDTGGYSRGGYGRGGLEPHEERDRHRQSRASAGRGGRDTGQTGSVRRSGGARERDEVRDSRGAYGADYERGDYGADFERGDWDGRGGDWRQGYGGYGVSERGGMHEDENFERAPDYEGLSGGYGFGGRPADSGRGDEPWPYLDPWAVPGPFTGRGPDGYQRSGEAIREDVCERLTRHGRLDASGIRVQVDRGEVTLEGTVPSRSAKRMAEDTAETVAGVRDVHNRLRIGGQDEADGVDRRGAG